MKKNEIKALAEEHWENYVKPLLELHGENSKVIEKIGFHFVSAFIHGAKHAGVKD